MASPETRHERSLLVFAREHRWEIIFGLVFAVLFGLWWEEFKVVRERADRITPERQALGTVRVLTVIDLKTEPDRQALAEWQRKYPKTIVTKDFAVVLMGSGFAVTDDGWIVTAAHVLDQSRLAPLLKTISVKPRIVVNYPHGRDLRGGVPKLDIPADTAIVKVSAPPPGHFLLLGKPEEMHRLDRVSAIGYPASGNGYDIFDPTMTTGEIAKIAQDARLGTVFQTTATIDFGSSGGPLVDGEGRVIGIVRAGTTEGAPFGFSVTTARASKLLADAHVILPEHYEHEGLQRQPWVYWSSLILGIVAITAYLVFVFRSFLARVLRGFLADPPHAGFWSRASASTIDAAIIVIVFTGLTVALILATGRYLPWYWLMFAIVPAWWIYATVCEWKWGATLGKRMAGLRVLRPDGRTLSLPAALARGAGKLVSGALLGLGFVIALFDRRRRTLHDRIAGTVVVAASQHTPWKMFAFGLLAAAIGVVIFVAHLVFLNGRAERDLSNVYKTLWLNPWQPDAPAMARQVATSEDRVQWMALIRGPGWNESLCTHGLVLMLSGSPSQAIHAFQRAAGDSWEELTSTGHEPSSLVNRAASKSGWCYLDLHDDRSAERMFALVLRSAPTNRDSILGIAVAHMHLGDAQAMRADYQKLSMTDRSDIANAVRAGQRTEAFYLTAPQLKQIGEVQTEIEADALRSPPPSPASAPRSPSAPPP
jgi:uncharacterized RDD family membrane protein YckC/S1-C subfamily serine protease